MTEPIIKPAPDAPVLVIGSASVDTVGRVKELLQQGVSNPASIRTSFGGVARNVAENLARLGQPVRLLTAIGDDETGDRLLKEVNDAGVDSSAVLRIPEQKTSTYIGVVNSRGELLLALDDMQIMKSVSPEYLLQHLHLFHDAGLLFVDTNLSKESLRTVFSIAKKAGIPVCANTVSATLAHRLLPYLSQLKIITPNSVEAAVLCNFDVDAAKRRQALNAAKRLVSQGVAFAIVTLAQFGVVYATAETSGHIPSIQTGISDPTGGGDALTATILFALLNDIPLDDAIRLGVSAATLTLQHPGSVLPDLSLEKLYDQLVI